MDGIRFRPARPADAPTILAIKQAAIGGIDSQVYTGEQIEAWKPDDEAVDDFRRAIHSERFEILIAETDETAAGYGVLNTDRDQIDAVFVHPDHAGEGIASSLVRQFESRARVRGAPELKIVSSLNARSFYTSLEYWDFGRKTRDIDGVEVEFAIMRKVLDR